MKEEFDKEVAKSIRKVLMGHIPITVGVKQIYKHFKTIDDIEKALPTLFPEEQVMLVKLLCDKKTGKFKFEDSEIFYQWVLKWQKEILYDPRPIIVQQISWYYKRIKHNLLSKTWWKLQYWKIRYGVKWKTVKMNSKWNNPVFINYGGNNEKETTTN